ncbi:hypothetical protein GCM10022384_17260 [Streptomyces marokkonensis]|uniref:Uncharacterized protein n=1 Tax=Streptomyces marokkonensis TaxID=324855 RepID=A0ABP7PJB2_9ACTN
MLIASLTTVRRAVPGTRLGHVTATATTLVFTPDVAGPALGAALVEPTDFRILLPALGAVPPAPAVPLARRSANADGTASGPPPAAAPA